MTDVNDVFGPSATAIERDDARPMNVDDLVRPHNFEEMVGQARARKVLGVAIQAAVARNEPLRHVLLYGESGLGKTTLATVTAVEMDSLVIMRNGAELKTKHVFEMATEIDDNWAEQRKLTVMFIDEIHRLDHRVRDLILPWLESFKLDGSRTTPFTLIGATTDPGMLHAALRGRFITNVHVSAYGDDEITTLMERNAPKVWRVAPDVRDQFIADPEVRPALAAIARRARGVPRLANNFLAAAFDHATIAVPLDERPWKPLNEDIVGDAMESIGVDRNGLNDLDRRYLVTLFVRWGKSSAGADAIARAVGDNVLTLRTMHEPHLVRSGYINLTARGRELTDLGFDAAKKYHDGVVEY